MKKSKRKSENTLRQMKMETEHSKICGIQQKQSKREVLTIQAFFKKVEKS